MGFLDAEKFHKAISGQQQQIKSHTIYKIFDLLEADVIVIDNVAYISIANPFGGMTYFCVKEGLA